jgi:CheY-like chemotaxis protein
VSSQWQLRPLEDLLGDQLSAMESFLRQTGAEVRSVQALEAAQELSDRTTRALAMSREQRLENRRRLDALRRQQRALVEQSKVQLQRSTDLFSARPTPRIVLAHRRPWVTQKAITVLLAAGAQVVAAVDDGSDAIGAVVAEQPDLLLVEDKMPGTGGLQVLEATRAYSPGSLVGAHLDDGRDAQAFLDAGAAAVFSRRIPPDEIARQLLTLLDRSGGQPLVCL